MKRNSKSRNKDIELYQYLDYEFKFMDSEYYGIFGYDLDTDYARRSCYKKLNIDMKRYQKILGPLSKDKLTVINKRNTHYFTPKKTHYEDYNCNIFHDELSRIHSEWLGLYEPLIKQQVENIEKPRQNSLGDYYNFQCGISSVASAQAWANWTNMINQSNYKNSCQSLIQQFYGQFFHMMCAKIEAVFVKVLNKNNGMGDRFDRTVLYATAVGKKKKVQDLEHFKYYDKLYCIWNFIKHNSDSTFDTLLQRYPEVLLSKKYTQGELAVYWLKFSKEMIQELVNGVLKFTNEFCKLVFDEDSEEAKWNYDDYFLQPMIDYFESYDNPLGLGWWDEID